LRAYQDTGASDRSGWALTISLLPACLSPCLASHSLLLLPLLPLRPL
jgi:hypothetical protein